MASGHGIVGLLALDQGLALCTQVSCPRGKEYLQAVPRVIIAAHNDDVMLRHTPHGMT